MNNIIELYKQTIKKQNNLSSCLSNNLTEKDRLDNLELENTKQEQLIKRIARIQKISYREAFGFLESKLNI